MKKIDFKGIKFKLWLQFLFFSLLIMLLLWFFQIIFINTYYQTMKKNELIRLGNDLTNKVTEENFQTIFDEASFTNHAQILLLKKNIVNEAEIIYFSNTMFGEQSLINNEEMGLYISQVFEIENEDNFASLVDKGRFKFLVYGDKIELNGEDTYFLMTSNLAPIESTVSVLKNQLVIISIIIILLSTLMSYLLSKKISKPITDINNTAKKLAKEDYHINFKGSEYKEIDQLSHTLNYVTEELSKTDNLRKELIANISHDLRTPLTMIKVYAEMIKDVTGENKQKREENLDIILTESERLNNLIGDILSYSKLQADTENFKFNDMDISQSVVLALKHFSYIKETKGFKVNTKIEEGLIVSADKLKIEQVIYNLLSNAINHSGNNKTIDINLKNKNGYAYFEITDYGEGISQEEIEHIWDRYYRASTGNSKGIGLGLSIVKSILNKHNAKSGVVSEKGKYTTFWFMLDLKK